MIRASENPNHNVEVKKYIKKLVVQRCHTLVDSVLFLIVLLIKNPSIRKLDGVGPVDNRPSTATLHHFVRKKKEKKKLHVTREK